MISPARFIRCSGSYMNSHLYEIQRPSAWVFQRGCFAYLKHRYFWDKDYTQLQTRSSLNAWSEMSAQMVNFAGSAWLHLQLPRTLSLNNC